MPTFLTTAKMDPALAARIEASVTGRKQARRPQARSRRLVSLARLTLVLTAVFATYSVFASRREAKRALEQTRSTLLESVRAQAASLRPEDHAAVEHVETWLSRLSGAYEGDLVADELRPPGALTAKLARPVVYVRGTIDAFGSHEQVAAASSTSSKDALLLCLLEPPGARTEKELLDKVRVAYSGGWNLESRTASVRRLNDALVGMPLLAPAWSEKVRAAADPTELAHLRTELDRAPLERAKQAARAEMLVAAIDEPGDGKGPTELDGERVHPVRVVVVDLSGDRILLRSRHVVDPTWITPAKRATYATGLDGCALGLDVLEDVRKAAKSGAARN